MSITTELRERCIPYRGALADPQDLRGFIAIADRIDKAHEEAVQVAFEAGQQSMVDNHGYIELPCDSEDNYIRPGDVISSYDGSDIVKAIRLDDKGNWLMSCSDHLFTPMLCTLVKPDTQEKIDADASQIDDSCGSIAALLRRQRELCEGNGGE